MSQSDHDYFMRRAREEYAAARSATHGQAERSHLELARRYEIAAAAAQVVPVMYLSAVPKGNVAEARTRRPGRS